MATKPTIVTTYDKFINVASDTKSSWSTMNLDTVAEALKALIVECKANQDYFMKPRFTEVLDGVVTILEIVAGIQNKTAGLANFTTIIFQLLGFFLKEEPVRLTLRDRHKLLFVMCNFFNSSLPQPTVTLVLSILEATSRNMVIQWKPPQLGLLFKNIYGYISDNPLPTPSLALSFQFLVNVCQENPSCALMGKLDGAHKKVMGFLRGFGDASNKNRSLHLLATHLLFHYEPMLPLELLNAGHAIATTATTEAVSKYQNTVPEDFVAPTFPQLKDFVTTLARNVEPFFTNTTANTVHMDAQVDARQRNQAISEKIKGTFIRTTTEILKTLKPLVSKDSALKNSNVLDELLQYVIILLPAFVPVTQHIESYKEALRITNSVWEFTAKGSPAYHGCLGVYVHIVDIVKKNREPTKSVFEKLVSEGLFGNHVVTKLSLAADVSPGAVERNIVAIRLMSCLMDLGFSDEVKKLDSTMLTTLVGGLVAPEDVLPNLKWRRTVCLLQILATISKYTTMLNQLINFVRSDNVSRQIANGIHNGDEQTIKNAIAIASHTLFDEIALSSITRMVVAGKDAGVALQPRMQDLSPLVYQGAISLDHALKNFPSPFHDKDGAGQPHLDDLLTWYNLKIELHNHELDLANQNIQQLQKTIHRLKILMEKQVQLVSRHALESETNKAEMLSLQNTLVSRQKTYNNNMASLEQDLASLKTAFETEKGKASELRGVLEVMNSEKEDLIKKLKQEEQCREEAVEKGKTLRENNRTLKGDISRLNKQLTESNSKAAGLEIALKEKEEQLNHSRVLYESERKKLETIRTVIGGESFGNLISFRN